MVLVRDFLRFTSSAEDCPMNVLSTIADIRVCTLRLSSLTEGLTEGHRGASRLQHANFVIDPLLVKAQT